MILSASEKKKLARRSNVKGKSFQRKVARALSIWFFNDPEKLKATPRSGGYRNQLVGDVTCLDSPQEFPFHVECKNAEGGRTKWNLQDFLREKSILEVWWRQTSSDSALTEKIPLLVFTRNYEDVYVAMLSSLFEKIEINTPNNHPSPPKYLKVVSSFSLVIFRFSDFLSWCPPDLFFFEKEEEL